jgi:DNA-directed RNA polymerase subunit RPC12/RpoP
MFEKCSCGHCSGHIEFDSEHAGQMVACPHCGHETKLYVPKVPLSKSSQNVSVEIKRGVNPLGIASLILGIIACLFCWIPFLGLFVIPLAAIGLLLALLGLIMASANKKTGFVFPISGGIVCLLSIIIALVMTGGFAVLIQKANTDAKSDEAKVRSKSSADQTSQNLTPLTFQQGNIKGNIGEIIHGFTTGESSTERGLIVKTCNFLLIKVSVSNTSSNRICDYTTFRDNAILTDDNGNNYRKLEQFANPALKTSIEERGNTIDGWMPPNGGWSGWLTRPFYPNSSRISPHTGRDDMLGFEIPDSAGKVLHLELQAENFGGTGKIQFEIPVSRIKNW